MRKLNYKEKPPALLSSITAFQMHALKLGCHRCKCKFCLRILQKFWIIRRVVSSFKPELGDLYTITGRMNCAFIAEGLQHQLNVIWSSTIS